MNAMRWLDLMLQGPAAAGGRENTLGEGRDSARLVRLKSAAAQGSKVVMYSNDAHNCELRLRASLPSTEI